MRNFYNLPNLLTISRIALIPFLVLFFYLPVDWANTLATIIFIIAAFTDWLDGYLARKLKQTSVIGAFLDPVADKLMISTALVLILQESPMFWLALPAIVIIGREIAISALREWMAELGSRAKVSVSEIGKIKTAAQMLAITLLIYKEDIFGLPVFTIGLVLLYLAVALTLWSMIIYLKTAWPSIAGNSIMETSKEDESGLTHSTDSIE